MKSVFRLKGLKVVLSVCLLLSIMLVSPFTGYADDVSFDEPLNALNSDMFYRSDGWANGPDFNVGWRANNVEFNNGIMALRLDDSGTDQQRSYKPYASGEYATINRYGYGRVEARMKAAKGEGLVTSLFTYYNADESIQRNDEIDIEILGKDTTKVELNYFTKGVGEHSTIINLGFDASEAFHNYAFEWSPTYIKWYVDGNLVHTENGSRGPLPTDPGHIMVNLWAGAGAAAYYWTGYFTYPGTPVRAYYDWIKFTPLSAPSQNLIQNPGFESGAASWNAWGNSFVVSNNAKSGTYSLRTGTGAGGRGQIIEGVTALKSYTFSVWGKVSKSNTMGYVGVDCMDANGNIISKPQLTFNSTSYTQKSVTFTAPAGTVQFQVFVWKNAEDGNGYIYVDDLSLIRNN
ncbi:MAG: beta-glucanase [Caldicoprobacterales bacterium]